MFFTMFYLVRESFDFPIQLLFIIYFSEIELDGVWKYISDLYQWIMFGIIHSLEMGIAVLCNVRQKQTLLSSGIHTE